MEDRVAYDHLHQQLYRLYQAGEYQAALEILNPRWAEFPNRLARLADLKMSMQALLGDTAGALNTMSRAIEQGVWWHEDNLRQDPDLASLQGDSTFERLVAICAERRQTANRNSQPNLLVVPPVDPQPGPLPLLLALHSRNNSAENFLPHWHSLTERGWLVAAPTSSQVIASGSFCWDDNELAQAEIVEHYRQVITNYPVDSNRVVLAGFSQGGGLSVELTITGKIPACGFLAIGPYMVGFDQTLATLQAEGPAPIRGYFGYGAQDHLHEMLGKIDQLLQEYRVPYRTEVFPDLAHEMPADMDAVIRRGMDFILG